MQINVIEYFENGALPNCADKLAVRDSSGDCSFGQLGRYAKNCAALILKRADCLRQPIPVFLPKSAQSVAADLAVLYSGNGYANLDIKSPPLRLKAILDNLDAPLIVTSRPHVEVLREIGIPPRQSSSGWACA